jgi:hypothetical protein
LDTRFTYVSSKIAPSLAPSSLPSGSGGGTPADPRALLDFAPTRLEYAHAGHKLVHAAALMLVLATPGSGALLLPADSPRAGAPPVGRVGIFAELDPADAGWIGGGGRAFHDRLCGNSGGG